MKDFILKYILPTALVSMFTSGFDASAPSLPPEVALMQEPVVVYVEVPLVSELLIFIETEDEAELEQLILDCETRLEAAHKMAENARMLGYAEDHSVVQLAKEEWSRANAILSRYKEKYGRILEEKWSKKIAEYPEASYVWKYLKEAGYNDYICAGILGNMMAECGGQTLKLQPLLYNSSKNYYGICQWSKKYYPEVQGATLINQCNFLVGNIAEEINMFGYTYAKGFKYKDFLNLENEREAALAFAKAYERCNSNYYSVRMDNAELAYIYFTT